MPCLSASTCGRAGGCGGVQLRVGGRREGCIGRGSYETQALCLHCTAMRVEAPRPLAPMCSPAQQLLALSAAPVSPAPPPSSLFPLLAHLELNVARVLHITLQVHRAVAECRLRLLQQQRRRGAAVRAWQGPACGSPFNTRPQRSVCVPLCIAAASSIPPRTLHSEITHQEGPHEQAQPSHRTALVRHTPGPSAAHASPAAPPSAWAAAPAPAARLLRLLEQRHKLVHVVGQAHAAPAAARGGLDHDGEPHLVHGEGGEGQGGRAGQREVRAGRAGGQKEGQAVNGQITGRGGAGRWGRVPEGAHKESSSGRRARLCCCFGAWGPHWG